MIHIDSETPMSSPSPLKDLGSARTLISSPSIWKADATRFHKKTQEQEFEIVHFT